jgi:hypothetical protein
LRQLERTFCSVTALLPGWIETPEEISLAHPRLAFREPGLLFQKLAIVCGKRSKAADIQRL